MQTLKAFLWPQPCLFNFLSLIDPKYVTILKPGNHLLNSISQFTNKEVGTTTKWGPHIPLDIANLASKAIA